MCTHQPNHDFWSNWLAGVWGVSRNHQQHRWSHAHSQMWVCARLRQSLQARWQAQKRKRSQSESCTAIHDYHDKLLFKLPTVTHNGLPLWLHCRRSWKDRSIDLDQSCCLIRQAHVIRLADNNSKSSYPFCFCPIVHCHAAKLHLSSTICVWANLPPKMSWQCWYTLNLSGLQATPNLGWYSICKFSDAWCRSSATCSPDTWYLRLHKVIVLIEFRTIISFVCMHRSCFMMSQIINALIQIVNSLIQIVYALIHTDKNPIWGSGGVMKPLQRLRNWRRPRKRYRRSLAMSSAWYALLTTSSCILRQ